MKTVTSTRHLGENQSTTHRLSLVAGACALALGASLAHAQTSTYTLDLTAADLTTTPATPAAAVQTLANDSYSLSVTSPQLNQGSTSATVQTAPALSNISLTDAGATPATVTNNSATATAAGNQNTTSASLNTLTNSGGVDGIGTIAAQVQLNGTSNALVDTSVVSITESGMRPAAATITGNTLSASTTINRSDTTVSGVVPVGYVSGAKGSIDVGYAVTGITDSTATGAATTTASVNLNTFQTSLDASANAGSAAKVTDSTVQLDISGTSAATGAPVLSAPLTVSNNTLSAQFDVNKSSNVVQATAGSASFSGSVGVTNVQANIESAASTKPTASVSGSSITSDLRNGATGTTPPTTSLSGTLDQSNNTISASSSGNSAGDRNAAGSILAGNAILLTSGADVTGTSSTTANAQTSGATTATSNTQADLALLNLQRNDTTNLMSSVTGGVVTARADNVTTGSVTLNGNSLASSAEGNLAGNLIEVIAANSAASAAAANVQANSGTPIEASNSGSLVSVGVGYTGQLAADAVAGTVTLNQNSLSATASGNASATNVVMLASNLTAQASTGAASVNVSSGATTATAGLSATNLQSNISTTDGAATPKITPNDIKASLGTAGVSALFTETGAAAGTAVALTGATVSLDQNTLNATATGNSASTGVTLTGAAGAASNATVQAAVGNSQLNDGTNGLMTVSSTVTDSGVLALGGATSNSQLSVSNNTQVASATGSSATNTLAANVTNLTVGPNTLAAGPASVSTTGATSTAALGLASVQINQQATVTASNMTTTPFAGVQLDSASGSQLAVNNNQASASSTGNSVANTTQLIATNIASTTGGANAIAAMSNLQSNVVTGTASAEVGTGTASAMPLVGVQVGGDVTAASSLTVSGNDVNATALGNTGSNQMAVIGRNLSSTAPTVATGTSSTASTGGTVTSEFSLANFQNDAVSGGRTATASNVVVGVNTTGALDSSNLTVANNQVTAEARNNQISNTANLTGFATLSTSVGLANTQNATTAVTATVTAASTGVVAADNITSANVTIDSNTVQGLATGSSANNSLTVSAAALAGNPKTTTTQTGVATTDQTAGTVTQAADFSLANNQGQSGDVTALVGATQTFNLGGLTSSSISGNTSTVTVSGNAVQGIAQSLSATNTLNLAGTTSATATAALGNLQVSSAAVSATTTATQGIASGLSDMTNSNLTVSGNTAKALAVGTSASNALTANSANLSGNSQLTSSGGGASYTVATPASTTADFAGSNVQQQSGALTAALSSSQLVNIGNADVAGGAISVSGNTAASVAQANSAGSSLTLTGANQSDLTGALLTVQTATAGVSATQVAADGDNTFAVRTKSIDTTAVKVSNNNLLVSAGMNEAFNQQTVSGATLAADATRGNGTAAYTLGANVTTLASASSGAAFSVQNVQSGSVEENGSVSASAQPGLIGIANSGNTVAESNLTVSGNAVTAKTNVNYASNALNLAASNTLAGSGSVNNVQTSAVDGGVTATIGDTATPVNVGIAPPVPVRGSTLTVSGNALNAQAGGNTAVNALNATALNSIGNGGVTASTSGATGTSSGSAQATFAVLNYQGNSSAMTATVQYASIGLGASTSLVNSTATVQNNAVLASGYGNTASNSLGLSALNGTANAASAGISNVQYNTGSVTALVSNVSNGIGGAAGVSGGLATVSGNSVAAQSVGNSAVNRIVVLR